MAHRVDPDFEEMFGVPDSLRGGGRSDPVVAALIHIGSLQSKLAPTTKRLYRRAVWHFIDWGGLLPASEAAILKYLEAHAPKASRATLAMRLAALSRWHVEQNFPNPVKSIAVRDAFAQLVQSRPVLKARAKTLHIDRLIELVRHLAREPSLMALRDSALVQLGFCGALGSSALVSLDTSHLIWQKNGLIVSIPPGVQDFLPDGAHSVIYEDMFQPLNPIAALGTWLKSSSIECGPVFRAFTRAGLPKLGRISPPSVRRILVSRALDAGMPNAQELTSVSMRHGLRFDDCFDFRSFVTMASL
ncbi:hypothetical protein [Pseudoduganella rhizocola]|uniref:hypothetical protein n=1 Tax=Pseudoduganella rhizocola TaxID=3382643 RepID=UPI0038B4F7D3